MVSQVLQSSLNLVEINGIHLVCLQRAQEELHLANRLTNEAEERQAPQKAASPAKARRIAASEPVAAKKSTSKQSPKHKGTAKPLAPTRIAAILDALQRAYPDAVCALTHTNAWELTVATILSAQSTDAGVNLATPELFRQFPTPATLAAANPVVIEHLVHRTGFYRAKTKSIMGAARVVTERFHGEIPSTLR